jgi:hypothetical protein
MTQVSELAHARAGDKGNRSNISVIAYTNSDFDVLDEQLTADFVQEELATLIEGEVRRYDLPHLCAFNFVIDGALAGGVTTSLRMDSHGKSLSYAMLAIELPATA